MINIVCNKTVDDLGIQCGEVYNVTFTDDNKVYLSGAVGSGYVTMAEFCVSALRGDVRLLPEL